MAGNLFSFRPCSEAEAVSILQEPTVARNFKGFPVGLPGMSTFVVNESVLVTLSNFGEFAEIHIAVPFRKRRVISEAFPYVCGLLRGIGYKGMFTTAPDSRKALVLMLKKLGFHKRMDKWVKLWELIP